MVCEVYNNAVSAGETIKKWGRQDYERVQHPNHPAVGYIRPKRHLRFTAHVDGSLVMYRKPWLGYTPPDVTGN